MLSKREKRRREREERKKREEGEREEGERERGGVSLGHHKSYRLSPGLGQPVLKTPFASWPRHRVDTPGIAKPLQAEGSRNLRTSA